MSAQVKTAVVNEVLEISNMFKENCALRHGLPTKPAKQRIDGLPEDPAPTVNIHLLREDKAVTANNSPSPGAKVADAAKSSLLRRAVPWLLTLGGLGMGGVGGWGLNWLLDKDQPVIVQPSTPATPEAKDGSLLQYLEDGGFHREEGPWQQQ